MAAALARSRAVIFTVDVAGVAACVRAPRASDLVDGVGYGPASSEQPAVTQPVAAGPVKVGEWSPRLEDVTLLVEGGCRRGSRPSGGGYQSDRQG